MRREKDTEPCGSWISLSGRNGPAAAAAAASPEEFTQVAMQTSDSSSNELWWQLDTGLIPASVGPHSLQSKLTRHGAALFLSTSNAERERERGPRERERERETQQPSGAW